MALPEIMTSQTLTKFALVTLIGMVGCDGTRIENRFQHQRRCSIVDVRRGMRHIFPTVETGILQHYNCVASDVRRIGFCICFMR